MALSWLPTGPLVDSRKNLTPDVVEAVGIGGNPKVLLDNWRKYVSDPEQYDDDVTHAFIRACSLCARRSPSHVVTIVTELASFPKLSDKCFRDLAAVASELGDAETVRTLFRRTVGVKRQLGFYLSLIHLAAETLKTPDMEFATEVCNEMAAHDIKMCFPQLKMMLHGFARVNPPPVDTIFGIVKYANEMTNGNPNICFMQKAVGILEALKGDEAVRAKDFISDVIGAPFMSRLVEGVIPPSFSPGSEHDGLNVTYYIIDPFGTNVESSLRLPPNTYLMFLYSSLRHLSEKCITCGVSHPLSLKAELIRKFLETNQRNAIVFPWEHEIMLHANPSLDLQNTPHSKMLVFMQVIRQTCAKECRLRFVTTDKVLSQAVAAIGGIDVLSAFPPSILAPEK